MKIHYHQLLSAFSRDKASKAITTESLKRFIRGFDKLIWVRRRDRMRQAVSLAIARQTQAWSSEENRAIRICDPSEVSPIECLRALSLVCNDDFGWERLVKALNLDVHVIWYEDLTQNYHEQSVNAMRHLGLDASITKIPEPPIQRQASDLNEQVLDQFLTYLGLSENSLSSLSNSC